MVRNLKLGEILKQAGIIDDFQLNSALSYQRHWGGRFGESLIKLGYLTEGNLQNFLARQFGLPQVELSGRKIPEDVLAYIPAVKAREFLVIPVERREISGAMHLVVAMTDPTNLMVIDSLQFLTGCRIKPALAAAEAIRNGIDRYYGSETDGQEELDLALEDLAVPSAPTMSAASPAPAPPAKTGSSGQPARTAEADQDDRVTARALKRLEERYENLVCLLLDKGILDHKELDDLM